jgi:hypothetical protein
MATKADFTADEWDSLHTGVTGAGMLVSLSDRDLSDSFGESTAMAKYLAGQVTAGPTQLIREIAAVHGTGFGFTASPEKIRARTMDALASSMATLSAKAPDDVDPYRALVLGIAQAVAEAKGGVTPVETSMIDEIRKAIGAG